MKICSNCAASNVNTSEFCTECGKVLSGATARGGGGTTAGKPARRGIRLPRRVKSAATTDDDKRPGLDRRSLVKTLEMKAANWKGVYRRADIMFILDCTESMGGEIDAIRDAVLSFVDMLRGGNLDVRIGLVEFRDRLIGEESRVLLFDGQPFTSDPRTFRREAMTLQAIGGGDPPESSLDAVLLALRQPFDSRAQKILVLITDAPPHVPDKEAQSVEEVAATVRAAGVSQFYLIIPVQEAQNQVYLHLCTGTRGIAFDLGKGADFRQRAADFRRTLLSLGKTISAATV